MYFVDSDGVICNFDLYLAERLGRTTHNPEEAYRVMVEDYENCFYTSKPLSGSEFYLNKLRTNPWWFVLTALSKEEHLKPYCKDIPVEEVLKRHKENKYKWYESRGISRDKILIVGCAKEKLDFCSPGDVLYDDRRDIIKKWRDLGGVGIHIPNLSWEYNSEKYSL